MPLTQLCCLKGGKAKISYYLQNKIKLVSAQKGGNFIKKKINLSLILALDTYLNTVANRTRTVGFVRHFYFFSKSVFTELPQKCCTHYIYTFPNFVCYSAKLISSYATLKPDGVAIFEITIM